MEKEQINIKAAEFIVDLYEIKASFIHKYMSKSDVVFIDFKYQFLSSIISNLCDKYKVSQSEIGEIIRDRSFNNLI